MLRSSELLFGPVTDVVLDLGLRLEFLVPTVAVLSMGAGVLAARYGERVRDRFSRLVQRGFTRT
jgi:hypothetical protein